MGALTKPAIWFILLLFPFSCQESGPKSTKASILPVNAPEEIGLRNEVEDFFSDELKRTQCPGGAIVIVKDSSILLMKGFGVRNTATNDPVDINTVFRIGSLSKGFSGVLASKLINQGYFRWDDNVREVIPEFDLLDKDQANRIQVRHLLSHTTGLGKHSYTNLIENGVSMDRIIPMFSKVKVYGKEGEFYAYQNAAFAMVEKVILETTGKTYSEIIQSELFDPAGMVTASSTQNGMLESDNIALPHRWSTARQKYYPTGINKKYYNAPSAGGINASIRDMGKWMNLLLGNDPEILSQSMLDSALSPEIGIWERRSYRRWEGYKKANYAMGWRVLEFENRDILYHGGYVNDFVSQIAIDREEKIGICVLFNAVNSSTRSVIPAFLQMLDDMSESKEKTKFAEADNGSNHSFESHVDSN